MFITREILEQCGWQAFERLVSRLLVCRGFSGVRIVGGSGDKGADIIAIGPGQKRWLIQAKYWAKPVPESELRKTLDAARLYRAANSVVVALTGIDEQARAFQRSAQLQGQSLTVWTAEDLLAQASLVAARPPVREAQGKYQELAIQAVHEMLDSGSPRKAMVVMATGLGKTFTAAEAIRRRGVKHPIRVLVVAHTNQLVLQLEKAFWPFLGPEEPTAVWNHNEKQTEESLLSYRFVFASRDSLASYLGSGFELPQYDLLLIDECHHAHSESSTYQSIISRMRAGQVNGPQLLGLTATPFLVDSEATLEDTFGDQPLVSIDMVYGLSHGFLSKVDYRLFTDNINWEGLKDLKGKALSPKSINRVFFIKEWDDGVVRQLQETWLEVTNAKAIVFCGTIEHAIVMRDKINGRGFCHAAAIFSGSANGATMNQHERNLVLADFESGLVNVICAVDIFNEGIDVPDVNIIVFNRVTHSRRIFIQQLGRGLRMSIGKEKAIVLDFAQDIRRFAAGLKMKGRLERPVPGSSVAIGNRVVFRNSAGEDAAAETYLRAWLVDVEAIEASGDDEVGKLQFPPHLS